MPQLEPNLVALGWFCLLWSICCVGFLQLSGLYPLQQRPSLAVIAATVLWLALSVGTIAFATIALRWTSIVIVGGVLILFLPAAFQALPERWRDGRAGLRISGCVMIAALALLACVAAPSFHIWFA
jgi:hypothetical protein